MFSCFDKDFCLTLEYHLSKTMQNLDDKALMRYWCDGILLPDSSQLKKPSIIQTKKIVTKAWFGPTGQDKYKMVINLGEKAMFNCLNNLRLDNTLSPDTSVDWIVVYPNQYIIELQLL